MRRSDLGRAARKGVIDVYITSSTIITAAGVLTALGVILGIGLKIVRWVDKQSAQDAVIAEIKDEQRILTEGILACLKGLKEQGCNGPVTAAVDKIETHLNKQAHK